MNAATSRHDQTILPPDDLAAMLDFARFLGEHSEPVLVGPDGEQAVLPMEVYRVLLQVVDAMAQGQAITVAPLHQMLTTQEAADLLGISRPTLVKLLERNELPYERPSNARHRRLRLSDVLEYRERRREDRRSRLDAMTGQASEDGLYATSATEYKEALRQARGKSD